MMAEYCPWPHCARFALRTFQAATPPQGPSQHLTIPTTPPWLRLKRGPTDGDMVAASTEAHVAGEDQYDANH